MKHVLTIVFLFVGVAVFAQNDLDGDWTGSVETPNGPFEINYTFKVEGSNLDGAWKSEFGETPIENGKIDEKNFSYSISFNGTSMEFTGEILSENEIVVTNQMGETKLTRVE